MRADERKPECLDQAKRRAVGGQAGIMKIIVAIVLVIGCGGEAYDEAAPVVQERPDAGERHIIPPCSDSRAPLPTDCQTLVYGDHGYCNLWSPCQTK